MARQWQWEHGCEMTMDAVSFTIESSNISIKMNTEMLSLDDIRTIKEKFFEALDEIESRKA